MSEFTKVIVTQGWVWAALLIIMLLLVLDQRCSLALRVKLEIISATSLAVGLFIVGMLMFAIMTSPSVAVMAAADSIVLMP
jgi:hypothetical protein